MYMCRYLSLDWHWGKDIRYFWNIRVTGVTCTIGTATVNCRYLISRYFRYHVQGCMSVYSVFTFCMIFIYQIWLLSRLLIFSANCVQIQHSNYVDTTFYIQSNSWQTLRFQKQQNQSVSGLSEAARNKRKHRNVVAMKFNLINYILETVSMILMLIFKEEVIILLYLLTNSCGTPLVYYLGIEENRKQAEEYFRWEE